MMRSYKNDDENQADDIDSHTVSENSDSSDNSDKNV